MQWKFPEGLTKEEEAIVSRLKKRSRFFVFLREIRSQLFDIEFQKQLAEAYAPRGQHPVPPGLLAMVCLLQAYTGASDAEAVEAAEMDARWQLVLGTLGDESAPFGQGSIVRFRFKMIEHDLDQKLLDRTVTLAKETGAFGWRRLRLVLDSSPLRGAGRVEDTWNLVGHAMSQLVSQFSRLSGEDRDAIIRASGASLLDSPSIKSGLDINWDDASERAAALRQVNAQAQGLLDWARERLPEEMADPDIQETVELLERIFTDDTEPDPEHPGGNRIRKGVAADRVCSVGDPEMRHGRKSKSKAFNGYKRHIGTFADAPFIFGAEALPANVPEASATPLLLNALPEGSAIEEVLIDRGYVSHERISQLSRQGVKIACRPWPENNRQGLFAKSKFLVELRSRTVTCPAGNTALASKNSGLAAFDAKLCSRCALRSKCTTAKKGRTVQIHQDEALLKKLQRLPQTLRGRKRLRERVVVEHRLARITQFQGNTARYKGSRANTLDLRRHAALANLVELRSQLAA